MTDTNVVPTTTPARDTSQGRTRLIGGALSHVRWPFVWPGTRDDADRPAPAPSSFEALILDGLAPQGGEVASRSRTAKLGERYRAASPEERLEFLTVLAEQFGPDISTVGDKIRDALSNLNTKPDAALAKLRPAIETPRVQLFRRFSTMPDGVRFVVDLRSDVRKAARRNPALEPLDQELKEILGNWFDLGMLEVRRLDWNTSAGLLQKLMAYEAVHPMSGWDDLRHRLDKDRRVFALFHPRMPEEPLIFVEVALTMGIAPSVDKLLDEATPSLDPQQADTAIFYSISNAQGGLAGIPFGDFLIKRVAAQLTAELPNLKTFSTLSPIPGFRGWLTNVATNAEENERVQKLLGPEADASKVAAALEAGETVDETVLLKMAAQYLVHERTANGRAADVTAHFHLSNGARVERLNPHADSSKHGWAQSAGLMVNYKYDLATAEKNVDEYRMSGVVATGPAVKAMLAELSPSDIRSGWRWGGRDRRNQAAKESRVATKA